MQERNKWKMTKGVKCYILKFQRTKIKLYKFGRLEFEQDLIKMYYFFLSPQNFTKGEESWAYIGFLQCNSTDGQC